MLVKNVAEQTHLLPGSAAISEHDAEELAEALKKKIRGEVRFDNGSRALYATDGSNYRQVPIGVVIPRDEEDVQSTVEACRHVGAPILARGGGTSLAGQCCNVAVILDFSKYMNRILEIDPDKKLARVQPGLVLDWLRDRTEEHHLTFAPDPSTHNHCTLGGMIGNNSCGVHSVMGGRTSDNVEEMRVITYEGLQMTVGKTTDEEIFNIIQGGGRRGEIYHRLLGLRNDFAELIRNRYPNIPRRVSGYNLDMLLPENGFDVAKALVGSESTCVLVLEATLRLIWSPPARSLLVLGYPDVYQAADHIMEVMAHKPTGLEGIDDQLVKDMKKLKIHPEDVVLLPPGGGWLLVEFGAETREESDAQAHELMNELARHKSAPQMKLFDNRKEEKMLWKVRESGLGATAHVPEAADTWEGWEDSAVPPEQVGIYLRQLRVLYNKYNYACSLYGHFGQGCIHTRIDFDFSEDGIKKFRAFLDEAADLVISLGGSLSGEHGDGQSRAELLPKMFGPELIEAFNEFKSIWDPDWKMNPGKVVSPYRIDENLRLRNYDKQPPVKTHFHYPEDKGDFRKVNLRCVGVGECRRMQGGTMCPSYRATKEEMHSTRGRARLLFEMLQGNPLKKGWRSEEVRESLDLCLACKGCKGDCPVSVDMATYKSEFLSHYYHGRLRPRHAYSMGLIHRWARLASLMPGITNFFAQTPVLSNALKWLGGISQNRQLPRFASQTFKQWFRRRGARNQGRPQVQLWPDTFNNYFHPQIAQAAVEVLESAGYEVIVPGPTLCCGRPLYDFGMLDLAKRLLQKIFKTLQRQIAAGIPVVVLEPSCASVFRDEAVSLFPEDLIARRLSRQTYLLAEFLQDRVRGYEPPMLHRKAIVHGHCHQKALMKMTKDEGLCAKMGMDFEILDSGCCGMAGSFGFEASHYDISLAIGELALLPAVRKADKQTIIVADGFSCREQISQTTDRHALHIAQVLQMALPNNEQNLIDDYPERFCL
jgi:FAD/FMN-containing dehydrogenase/Fe-S oxidoreductase